MRINRKFLYAGTFLLAVGGVLVAAEVGALDTTALTDTLRLWPLIIVAIGASLVLRRSQVGLASGMLAAAMPGLVLGGAAALVPRYAGDCGAGGQPVEVAAPHGVFESPARVSITSACGTLTVSIAPDETWELRATNTGGRAPLVDASRGALTIDAGLENGWEFLDRGRDSWDLRLPPNLESLHLVSYAGESRLNLGRAVIEELDLRANAARIEADLSEARVGALSAVVNVGELSVRVPANADLAGSLRIGGGELEVCSPKGVGLRVDVRGEPNAFTVEGFDQADSVWESPDYATAAHSTDLTVRAHFAAVKINPIGGCS